MSQVFKAEAFSHETPQSRTPPFDQYRLLAETVSKNNDMREQANNFWTTVNVVLISGLAYIKDASNIDLSHKPAFMWVVISLGYVLSLTWLSYLGRVKRMEETGTALLAEMETSMPHKIFTKLNGSKPKEGKSVLTLTEIMVPTVFLLGYFFFTVGLIFFKQEAIRPAL